MGLSERTNVGVHHIERYSVKCIHWSGSTTRSKGYIRSVCGIAQVTHQPTHAHTHTVSNHMKVPQVL